MRLILHSYQIFFNFFTAFIISVAKNSFVNYTILRLCFYKAIFYHFVKSKNVLISKCYTTFRVRLLLAEITMMSVAQIVLSEKRPIYMTVQHFVQVTFRNTYFNFVYIFSIAIHQISMFHAFKLHINDTAAS